MGMLDRAREILSKLSPWSTQVVVETAEQMEEKAESRWKANRRFDRHGPSDRDLLPGGRFEARTGRRRGRWLDR